MTGIRAGYPSGYPNNGWVCDIPPEVLGGDLLDVRPLNASGGFSNLFRARKTGLDVDVVIKRTKRQFHGRLNDKSEAHIMTALRHQYLPRIYDLRTGSDGYSYTIMELVPGCTLRDYVSQRGALDQKQALKWTRQLCEVVAYMHSRPKAIYHSDLKPENVMITPQGDVCVIDFNASLEESGAELEAIGITAGFAAPEQYNVPLDRLAPTDPLYPSVQAAQGMGKVTARTDLYAIGALAYYMLTGYRPGVWSEGVIPLGRYQIVLGDAFCQVIERAMQHRPADRFSSAAEMLRALNNLEKLDSRYRSWVRSCRLAALLVGVGLSLSILCVLLGVRQLHSANASAYGALVQQAQQAVEKLDYDGGSELLRQAIGMDDTRIEAYLQLGALLYRCGEYQQAIDLLSDVEYTRGPELTTDAFNEAQGQVSYLLGCCYYQLEQYADALTNYQLATYFLPQEAAYQRDLAICYAKTGNQAMADKTLQLLQELDCAPVDLALVEGEIRYAQGSYQEAYAQLSQAAQLADSSDVMIRAYIQAARCCQQLGAGWTDTEIQLLETACTRVDVAANSQLLQMLADAYIAKAAQDTAAAQGWYSRALDILQQLRDRGYTFWTVQEKTALVLEYLGRYDEAEQLLLQAQAASPNDYRVPMRLALLCADREGKKDNAQRDYTAMGAYWRQAQQLYGNAGVQDTEMMALNDMAAQLQAYGWQLG